MAKDKFPRKHKSHSYEPDHPEITEPGCEEILQRIEELLDREEVPQNGSIVSRVIMAMGYSVGE